nr:hypothetical protein [Tanacetum cinerariifolium]
MRKDEVSLLTSHLLENRKSKDRKHGLPPEKRLFFKPSYEPDSTPNLVVHEEGLEIWDNHSHGDVCLSWGRWGEFVGGRGRGGDGLESGGRGVMGDGGKTGLGMNSMSFKTGGKMTGVLFWGLYKVSPWVS